MILNNLSKRLQVSSNHFLGLHWELKIEKKTKKFYLIYSLNDFFSIYRIMEYQFYQLIEVFFLILNAIKFFKMVLWFF